MAIKHFNALLIRRFTTIYRRVKSINIFAFDVSCVYNIAFSSLRCISLFLVGLKKKNCELKETKTI